jgi:hypothetical protein
MQAMALTIPYFVQLAAGNNGENTFWVQLLVIVILAAGAGVYSVARSRAKHIRRLVSDEAVENLIEPAAPSHKRRNTAGGMELLTIEFLAEVVEHTDAVDKLDVAMRGMCFAELVRRKQLLAVSSDALIIYTRDEEGFFDKFIRREAMAELAGRTPASPSLHSVPLI